MGRKKSKGIGARIQMLKIGAFALLGLAALTAFGLASFTRDYITEGLIGVLRRMFGGAVYAAPIALGILGFWLLARAMGRKPWLSWRRPLGALLLFLTCLPTLHLLSPQLDPRPLASQGSGGGYLGWLLAEALVAGLGTIGAYTALTVAGALGLILVGGVSPARITELAERARISLGEPLMAGARRFRIPNFRLHGVKRPNVSAALREALPLREKRASAVRPSHERKALGQVSALPHRREWDLPDLEAILELDTIRDVSEQEIRRKTRIIQDTLRSFGVPGRVVEVNQGPTVTQFGVEPGYVERKDRTGSLTRVKVRVSKIGALSNDLSLALAAAPIRIQAPVPGRSMIGIEVPNDQVSMVPLRRVMESEQFRRGSSPLKLALGQDVSGQPVVADLARMPHLLIAGATGSGKSVCINSLVTCLLLNNSPSQLRLLMIDPKMVELVNFNGIPHLLTPVVVQVQQVVGVLSWLLQEMDRRYKLFSAARARSLEHYNIKTLTSGAQQVPRIALVIDELADLMLAAPDQVESSLCRLAQMSRATGIHLIVATQRPSVDVLTGLIKVNFPARISFAVTSQIDSRVILDVGGAESLLGRGDMLFLGADSSSPSRLQGCFVSDREIGRLVRFWKGLDLPEEMSTQELVQQALWPELAPKEEPEEDKLLDEAIDLVKREAQASTTFLQRRLRIGYVRASRLMDQLEERGVIGPPETRGSSRKLLETTEEIPWTTN